MDNIEGETPIETPKRKRRFLEVAISPDGKAAMDPSCLKDILSELLDEKLEAQLKSIKDEINKDKQAVRADQRETNRIILNLKKDCDELKAENVALKQP